VSALLLPKISEAYSTSVKMYDKGNHVPFVPERHIDCITVYETQRDHRGGKQTEGA